MKGNAPALPERFCIARPGVHTLLVEVRLMMGVIVLSPDAPRFRLRCGGRSLCGRSFVELPLRGRRQLRRGARLLRENRVRTILLPRENPWSRAEWAEEGLRGPSPVPLCRANAALLALAALEEQGLDREKCLVTIRGDRPAPEVRRAAELLCPAVKGVALDLKEGGDALADDLYWERGMAVRRDGAGQPAQVVLTFSPRDEALAPVELKLYREDFDLQGLTLTAPELPLWEEYDAMEQLAALWEGGGLPPGSLRAEWT